MSVYLQDRLHVGSLTVLPIAKVRCACCGGYREIRGAEEIEALEADIVIDDIQKSLTSAMDAAGWERMNCPSCVKIRPDLAKQDHEDDRADDDNGWEEAV